MECKKKEDKLLLYFHEVLEPKEAQEIENHLKECASCKEKYNKIRSMFQDPLEVKPPNNLSFVLNKAKEIEKNQQVQRENIAKVFILARIVQNLRKNVKVLVPVVLLVFAVFAGLFYFRYNFIQMQSPDKLYIVSAFGEVKINGKNFNSRNDFQYSLGKPLNIDIIDGECVLQINTDKQIMLKENTNILISADEKINIDFIDGLLVGKVIKSVESKKLVISSDDKLFKIIGTVFSISKEEEVINFKVKEGVVECEINEQTIFLKDNEKLKIKDKKIIKDKISKIDIKKFEEIESVAIVENIEAVESVIIDVYPLESEIYLEDKFIGKSPALVLLTKDTKKEFLIKKEGYKPVKYIPEKKKASVKLEKIEPKVVKPESVEKETPIVVYKAPEINERGEIDLSDIPWMGESDRKGGWVRVEADSILRDRECNRAEYDFEKSGRWIQLVMNLDVNVEGLKAITFDYLDTNKRANKFEIRISDYNGSLYGTEVSSLTNYYDITDESGDIPKEWQKVVVDLNDLAYLGGGDTILDQKKIKRIVVVLEKIEGGFGEIGISDFILKR